jgi:hypothetical protein
MHTQLHITHLTNAFLCIAILTLKIICVRFILVSVLFFFLFCFFNNHVRVVKQLILLGNNHANVLYCNEFVKHAAPLLLFFLFFFYPFSSLHIRKMWTQVVFLTFYLCIKNNKTSKSF